MIIHAAGFLIAWFLLETEFYHRIIDYITPKVPKQLNVFFDVFSCFKCLSFWLTLAITFNPLYAIIAAFTATTYEAITTRY